MPKKQLPIEPAYSILYAPINLPAANLQVDVSNLLDRITPALDNPFNGRQQEAFAQIFNERVSLIWGPPGTGKTTVLAGAILARLALADETNKPVSICVGASNYNAIDKVLNETIEIYERFKSSLKIGTRFARVRSPYAPTPISNKFEDIVRGSDAAATLAQSLNEPQTSFVIGGTYRQLGKMAESIFGKNNPRARWFDLLVIDESSQMPVAAAGAYFLLLKEDGNFVSAGDHFQLGPIYGFEMLGEVGGEGLYDCIFTYLINKRDLQPTALNENYRNNGEIAEWSKNRFYSQGFIARNSHRRLEIPVLNKESKPKNWTDKLIWSDDYGKILDPNLPVAVVTYHAASYTVSNPFEARSVAALAWFYRQILVEQNGGEFDEEEFWNEKLGIITPHRAQMAVIRNKLLEIGFTNTAIVDTVDRFQGLERDFIIASYAVADADFIRSEESFILNPRRFNVTLTRPRSKFVMFISDSLVRHLPSDIDMARNAAHLQLFVGEYCTKTTEIFLPSNNMQSDNFVSCQLRTPQSIKTI